MQFPYFTLRWRFQHPSGHGLFGSILGVIHVDAAGYYYVALPNHHRGEPRRYRHRVAAIPERTLSEASQRATAHEFPVLQIGDTDEFERLL